MLNAHWRSLAVHAVYGLVLFVVTVSTLEGLSDLNDHFPPVARFHWAVLVIAVGVAFWEARTMKGLEGLKTYLRNADPLPAPSPRGEYSFRPAYAEEIGKIHRLASQLYGSQYSFSDADLRNWFRRNPKCLYVMLCNNRVVGYIDAFPISTKDYESLLAGGDERKLEPQTAETADSESSFYIASIVVKKAFRGNLLRFIDKAMTFYTRAYPSRSWARVCAMAYTRNGAKWIKQTGMLDAGKGQMWYVDRQSLAQLSADNRTFWSRLLRAQHPSSGKGIGDPSPA